MLKTVKQACTFNPIIRDYPTRAKRKPSSPTGSMAPRAVDQAGWKKIIGDKPTLIMLDELPPYLENASTTVIGGGTLATVSTYTLSCLMSAALELPRCCIVIANLSGSYVAQTKAIAEAISNLQQEASRQASTITPVQLAGTCSSLALSALMLADSVWPRGSTYRNIGGYIVPRASDPAVTGHACLGRERVVEQSVPSGVNLRNRNPCDFQVALPNGESAAELPPQPLAEPYVTLSRHTAPVIQPCCPVTRQ